MSACGSVIKSRVGQEERTEIPPLAQPEQSELWPVDRLISAYLLDTGLLVAMFHREIPNAGALEVAHAVGILLIWLFAFLAFPRGWGGSSSCISVVRSLPPPISDINTPWIGWQALLLEH